MMNASDNGRDTALLVRSRGAACRAALVACFTLTGLFAAAPALAVYPFNDAEWGMLPKYCHHQGNVSQRHRSTPSPEWKNYFGSDFEHIHHWCAVYMWMGRAFKAGVSSPEGRSNLARAEADIAYFLDRARPDSPIGAEVYTRLGEVYLLQGKPGQAEPAFKRAHEINPARWQPYLLWAHYLYKNGRVADARQEVSVGLEHAPDSKALKSFLAEMDAGKKIERK